MPVPILETERLILRPMSVSDADAYYKYFNDWEIVRYLGKGVPWPYTIEAAQNYAVVISENKNALFWSITKKDRGKLSYELIGAIEFFEKQQEGQRGFWLAREFHDQGLMTEAAGVVTDYWFNVLQKPSLRLRNAIGNPASRRVKEKTGARFIETVPKQYMDPEFSEAEIWEITADEWQKFRSKK